MKYALKSILIIFLTLLFIIISTLGLSYSETGTRIILKLANHVLPGELTFSHLQGALLKHLDIAELEYKQPNINLHIQKLSFTWQWTHLLTGNLTINNFSASHVNINLTTSSHQLSTTNFRLPVDITIKQADITHLLITENSIQRLSLEKLFLSGQLTSNGIKDLNLSLQEKNNKFTITGSVNNNTVALDWAANIPNSRQISQSMQGEIISNGHLNGKWNNAHTKIIFIGNQLIIAGIPINKAALNIDGTTDSHNITANIVSKNTHIAINANGSWINKTNNWLLLINTFSIKTAAQQWQLLKATQIAVNQQSINIQPFCLNNGLAKFCSQLRWTQNKDFALKLELAHLPAAFFTWLLPPNYSLRGYLNANALLSLNQQQQTMTINSQSQKIILYDIINPNKVIDLNNINLQAHLKDQQLSINLTANLNDNKTSSPLQLKLNADRLDLLHIKNKKTNLNGTLKLKTNNLAIIKAFIPDINTVSGALALQLNLSGSTALPNFNGELTLNKGAVTLKEEKITIKNIALNASLKPAQANYTLTATSGGGQVKSVGHVTYTDGIVKTTATITGHNFLVFNTPTINVYASPQLTLNYSNEKFMLNGKILIPKANINIQHYANVVTLPKETVFVEKKTTSTPDILALYSNVELILGNNIYINIKGLKGQLEGNLTIKDTPATAAIASGKLKLTHGTFSFYGQELTVTHAYAYFINSLLTNPAINLQAQRTIKYQQKDLDIGITATGTADNPTITLFTNPAGWSQTDIVSLLIFGQPAENISKDRTAVLIRAMQALVSNDDGSSIMNFTKQIKSKLGLSELSFESRLNTSADQKTTTQSTALVLGKQLTSKLDINYSSDLINDLNILNVRYRLSEHWTIQSQSGTEGTGVDILYSIEK